MANMTNKLENAGGDLTARALREAFFAGLISLGLFFLFVGLKSDQNILNELILVQRWGLLAIFVIVAAVGRFVMVAYLQPFLASQKVVRIGTGLLPDSVAKRFFKLPYFIAAAAIAVALFA